MVTLNHLIKMASSEKFDLLMATIEEEENHQNNKKSELLHSSSSESVYSYSSSPPITPTSVLPPELKYCYSFRRNRSINNNGETPSRNSSFSSSSSSSSSPLLRSLRLQSVGKLSPFDVKRLSFHKPSQRSDTNNDEDINDEINDIVVDDDDNNDDMDEVDAKSEKDIISDDNDLVFDMDESFKSVSDSSNDHTITYKPAEILPPPQVQQNIIVVKTRPPPPPPLQLPQNKIVMETCTPPSPNLQKPVSAPPPPPPMLRPGNGVAPPPPPPPMIRRGNAVAPPPPPPPMIRPGNGGAPPPPPPMAPPGKGGAPPPPPPSGAGRCLRPKATTKLKRSSHIGNLYRTLKGKVEGSNLNGKSSSSERKRGIGQSSAAGEKQGMAQAIAEMTKRSSYFQQIEADVKKYSKQIIQMRSSISNFKASDMIELVSFHKDIESVLENLEDESQVLSRFEGFPMKKLEAIRMGAALYNKLNSILTDLQNWNLVLPSDQFLDKVERYFNKIKVELDALDRSKEEECKKFKSQNIEFDFNILFTIKEAMVDVSSHCMELVLKERHEAESSPSSGSRVKNGKILWRAFQFVFRVYTFAGGQDERADRLTRELARQIETDPINVAA